MGDQPEHFVEGTIERLRDLVMVIPGQDDGIVRDGEHDLPDPLHHLGLQITVEICQLHHAKSLKGEGQ